MVNKYVGFMGSRLRGKDKEVHGSGPFVFSYECKNDFVIFELWARIANHKCSKPYLEFIISFTLSGFPPHFSTISLIISTSNSLANFSFGILYPFKPFNFL